MPRTFRAAAAKYGHAAGRFPDSANCRLGMSGFDTLPPDGSTPTHDAPTGAAGRL